MTGNVIVGFDESPHAKSALRWAADYAALHDLTVTALMAWSWIEQHHPQLPPSFDPHYSAEIAAKVLDDLVDQAVGDRADIQRRTVCDLPGRAILDAAEDAELIVVGARGMGGFRGLLLGSVSRQILHGAHCPVAVVRDPATHPRGPIIVGVDGSYPSRRALEWAIDHARSGGLHVIAVHAWHLPTVNWGIYAPVVDRRMLDADAEAIMQAELGHVDQSGLIAPVELRVIGQRPSSAVLDTSADASLIVVGSRGRSELAHLTLGSVSDQVSHHATCPVVVVR